MKRKESAGCGTIPGNRASLCSHQSSGGVLPERCAGERYSRHSGGYFHRIYRFPAQMEKEHPAFYCGWNHPLYGTGAVGI